jgi:hypothetical protein
MSCCKKLQNLEARKVSDMQSATDFGFDPQWVADMVAKYGDDVLPLILEAMRLGFTKEFVMDTVSKLGPVLLDIIVTLKNKQRMMASGDVAVDAGSISVTLVEILLNKFGPEIIAMLKQWLIDHLTTLNKS